MKANISLALNGILLLAVAYLFSQHLSSGSKEPAGGGAAAAETSAPLNIVFVNADTLFNKYEYFRQQQDALEKRQAEAGQRLNQKGAALENEFRAVQQKIQEGLLAPSQIADEEKRLGQKQQALMAEQEKLSKELVAETQRIQLQLETELRQSLDEMRKRRGYDYILQYGQGSSVLLAADSLDITTEVLEILNQKKPEGEEKASGN
ncbi:MAG: OmpH family outer membrane protein [Phaeodactylibacter sp.]|nr:OmpH family outer membrane protein [Phaeodactylibacter sp.]MCB9053635.1 OmpH family outer membrane protein [Lewinellaceae bacterium]